MKQEKDPELQDYDIIVFDLDNTLTESKTVIDNEMSDLICNLLKIKQVAIVSGGGLKQFQKQVIGALECKESFSNLHIFPTDGAMYYKWHNQWKLVYKNILSENDKQKIRNAFTEALEKFNFNFENIIGELIEDRESAMVFSGLGQDAPLEIKKLWDPDGKKRIEIKRYLDDKIPEFEVHIAGTTSIDITLKGLDKAYCILKIKEYLKIPIEKMLFVGDALIEGSNDYPVMSTGVKTVKVNNPNETKGIIRDIIKQTNL